MKYLTTLAAVFTILGAIAGIVSIPSGDWAWLTTIFVRSRGSDSGQTQPASGTSTNLKVYVVPEVESVSAGADTTYAADARNFLSDQFRRQQLEDKDSGIPLTAQIVDLESQNRGSVEGNHYVGQATVKVTFRASGSDKLIEMRQSCSADGSDDNDAKRNALSVVASAIALKVKSYAETAVVKTIACPKQS